MKIKVTLQQEVECDTEDCFVSESFGGDGLDLVPREIDICPRKATPAAIHIKAKDLKIGDKMYDCPDQTSGYSSFVGEITKIESPQDKNIPG